MDLAKRFLLKFEAHNDGCWLWEGATSPRGYGWFWQEGRAVFAHRASYELFRGPIPADLELDHLCRNHGCVNPWHLEAVTHTENVRRGESFAVSERAQTYCSNGHPYSPENTYRRPQGGRDCRICRRERVIKWKKQHEAAPK